jgi:dTDP-L-rhamnose 4-epimerase
MGRILDRPIAPEITGKYRMGDVRHCVADISKAGELLGYRPQTSLEQGLRELAQWLAEQRAEDRAEAAQAELAARGLAV